MQSVKQYKYDVIVIGGGASGMMAAGRAAELGARVLVLEKNKELGKKLKISGGGRCNITNAEFDTRKFLDNFPQAKKFLYSPFSEFSVQETFDFFEGLGLPLVVEARKRAFPKSQRAMDVFTTLENYMKKHGVEVRKNVKITEIRAEGKTITAIKSKKETFEASYFILATGGMSAPETGSTGDGFRFLEKLGHSVSKPNPNIVPLTTDESWMHNLAGTALSFMTIRFKQGGKTHIKKTGKILFTHFGISGPLILNSSYDVQQMLKYGDVQASIDLFPDTDFADLDKRILKLFEQNKNKMFKNIIGELVPEALGKAILNFDYLNLHDRVVNSITKDERKAFTHTLKDLSFPITGTLGFEKSVIADGGVDLKEVDFKTMQSKLFPNLLLLGDILNINRPSGGYSLQLCWTTAWVASNFIGKQLKHS